MTPEQMRGIHPKSFPPDYPTEQVLVTISMDARLYDWLMNAVGDRPLASCVEEAITTAVRSIRGDIDMMDLVRLAADIRRVKAAAVLFGEDGGYAASGTLGAAEYEAGRAREYKKQAEINSLLESAHPSK